MFLEDECVIRRLRATRVSISLLVAFVAFAASILMTVGLATTVYAEDRQPRQEFVQLAAAPVTVAPAAELIAQSSVSAKLPHMATRADEQILRGIVMLLAALVAASGLAVWRRRVRGIFAGTGT